MARTAGRILISGASGMIGTALADDMGSRGVDVVKLTRKQGAGSEKTVSWDPSLPVPIAKPEQLGTIDAAIHLCGANVAAHRWTAAYKKEIFASRIETTHALVRVLQSLKHPPSVLVSASATGFYGDRGDEVMTEDSTSGSGFLAETCRAWEAAASTASETGIRVVHLRFGVVLAAQGGALAKVLPLFRAGLGGKLGDGRQWMSWITLHDLVRMVVHIIKDPRVTGAVNVVAPNPLRNSEYTQALGHAVHRPAMMAAPGFALRLAVGEMAQEALLASTRTLPEKIAAIGFRFEHPEIGPALRSLLPPHERRLC